jgi:hypothetical protein
MGYSTKYTLEWTPTHLWKEPPSCEHSPSREAKFCAQCGKVNRTVQLDEIVGSYIGSHDEMRYALTRSGETAATCKWYGHEEDLVALSKEITGVIFHLSGVGEDPGDIWDAWALDGKVHKASAKIVRAEPPRFARCTEHR